MENLLNETQPTSNIRCIIPKEEDKYDVYFSFLDIPVTMNKAYLENVIRYNNNETLNNQK